MKQGGYTDIKPKKIIIYNNDLSSGLIDSTKTYALGTDALRSLQNLYIENGQLKCNTNDITVSTPLPGSGAISRIAYDFGKSKIKVTIDGTTIGYIAISWS